MSDQRKSKLGQRVQAELDALRGRAQFRTLDNPSGINLYSNDYLGFSRYPGLKQAAMAALDASESVAGTGSRLLSGNSPQWESLEQYFAEYIGVESSLYFGSGYAANIGLVGSLVGRGDVVFSDELNHASLIDGTRLSGAERVVYAHADTEALESALRGRASNPGAKLIVTESLFSMDGDIAPLARIAELARFYGADVIVDEAHAIGVVGPGGRGICASLGIEREVFATVHTCGKALASVGAFVCGDIMLREFLINRARTFLFSTALPSYIAGQIRAAIDLARVADDRRAYLLRISERLRQRLAASDISVGPGTSQIIPIRLGTNHAALKVAAELQRAGFAVRAIRPPTVPEATSRIRVSLTAALAESEIDQLAAALVSILTSLKEKAIIPAHA